MMSYDISWVDENGVPYDTGVAIKEGGTYRMDGETCTMLNVTYNYSSLFSFKQLDGMKLLDCWPLLKEFSDKFKECKPCEDYWADTPGNVKKAVDILLGFVERFPEGRFKVE